MRLARYLVLSVAVALPLTAQTNPKQEELPQAPAPQPQNHCPEGRIPDKYHPERCIRSINIYERFLSVPSVPRLTPGEKGILAARNVLDPFNAATIALTSGITVASDSHSDYGPGMPGFGKAVGVAYTQDITGEFFGTFLIPSVAHQDPHYHRMPHASIPRRILNALTAPELAKSDYGKTMPNYSFIVGTFIDGEIANLYVPGRETDAKSTATRYLSGYVFAPIDFGITEFLPDVARKLHVRVVLVQQIINHIAGTPNSTQ